MSPVPPDPRTTAVPVTPTHASNATALAAMPALAPKLPAAGRRVRSEALAGSADALSLAQLALSCAKERHLLAIVAAAPLAAQRLAEEIPWFAPGLRVALLPDWETLPYDHFSPHQDLISERLATLHHVRSQSCDVLVVPVTTALYPLPPVEYLAAFTFFPKRGERLDLAKFRRA